MDNKFLSDPIFGRVKLMLDHGLNERIRVVTFFTQIHLSALIVNLIPHNPHVKNF
jgi:small basic protein